MRILGIQILGMILGLFMLYITYVSGKKREFNRTDLILWSCIWIGLILGSAFPVTLDIFLETFDVISAIDFISIGAVMVLTIIIFSIHKTTRKNQKKINIVIKKLALETAKENKNGTKSKNNDRRS